MNLHFTAKARIAVDIDLSDDEFQTLLVKWVNSEPEDVLDFKDFMYFLEAQYVDTIDPVYDSQVVDDYFIEFSLEDVPGLRAKDFDPIMRSLAETMENMSLPPVVLEGQEVLF